jgi:nitric oxide reductase subunit C
MPIMRSVVALLVCASLAIGAGDTVGAADTVGAGDTVGAPESGGVVASEASPMAPPEQLALGIEVYLQSYCGACHALAAAGTAGAFGPSHDDARALAEQRLRDPNYRGAATTPEDYIRESIVDPGVYIVPGYAATPHRMPAYGNLSDEALDALVALLMHR